MVNRIASALEIGKLFIVVKEIRGLLLHVCRFANVKDEENQRLTYLAINDLFFNQFRDTLQTTLTKLTLTTNNSFKEIDSILTDAIHNFPTTLNWELVHKYLSEEEANDKIINTNNNLYLDTKTGIAIFVDNVHGVKGETHDATLYLETEHKNGTDMDRVLRLLSRKGTLPTNIQEKSRKCVYVGFSRPRHLLCVTIRVGTYDKHSALFSDWDVTHMYK